MKQYKIEITIEAEQVTKEQIEGVTNYVFNGFTEVPFYISSSIGSSYLVRNPCNLNQEPINVPSVNVYELIHPESEDHINV